MENDIRKNTILVNKKNKNIKLRVVHIHNSGRRFQVESVLHGRPLTSHFNYDDIVRRYDVMPMLSDILKKL